MPRRYEYLVKKKGIIEKLFIFAENNFIKYALL